MKNPRLTKFIKWFAKRRRHYDQNSCHNCIAAYALMWELGTEEAPESGASSNNLARIVKIPRIDAAQLYACQYTIMPDRAGAVRVLKHYAKTGMVEWDRVWNDPDA